MKTLRKLGMMIAAMFAVIGFTACDDDNDDVANTSFTGSWRVVENTNLSTYFTALDVIKADGYDGETSFTPVSITFNEDNTGSITYIIPTDVPDAADPSTTVIADVEYTSAFTYTITPAGNAQVSDYEVSDHLATVTMDFAETDFFEALNITGRYSINGDILYLYTKYPQAADVFRKI